MNEIGMICQRLLEYITIHKKVFINNFVQTRTVSIRCGTKSIKCWPLTICYYEISKMDFHVFVKTSLLMKMKNILKSFWE